MRRNVWHLHPVDVIVSANHMIESVLPVHCHKWHSIIIVKQEYAISIYGLLHFLSHFLSFRQGGHTADWNYSRPSNQPLKNWHVHDIYQQIQIRIDLLLQFPEWQAWLLFSICPYVLSRSEDSSFGIPSCLSSSAFAISLASSALDGAADISQMQHEESACVLRSMPRNPLQPYFSINHRIFFSSERNSRLSQKDSKYPFLLNVVLL